MGPLGKPRGASARLASMAGVNPAIAALFTRKRPGKTAPPPDLQPELDVALARIAELEREVASLRGHQADADRLAAHVRNNTRRGRRFRWARGSARVRDLRERLRMALLMVDRLRVRNGERPHRALVGGVEDLRERASTLPALGGSPYSTHARSAPLMGGGG